MIRIIYLFLVLFMGLIIDNNIGKIDYWKISVIK